MWVFDRPVFLLLLVLVPYMVHLRYRKSNRGGRIRFSYSLYHGERFSPPVTFPRFLISIASIVYWLAIVLIILALAGPTKTTRERVYLTRGVDIMLVVDQSASMAAADFRPGNRFETARSVITRFINDHPGDHIGLVGISAEAALRVPPTLDHDFVLQSLESMKLMELGDGTAIGMGIALAALHLSAGSAEDRVIVLLTDGVNNAGEISPESAARAAADAGIRIYAIGVGSDREAFVEVRDPETGQLYQGTVRDSYDEESLRRIAEVSGGRYFTAGSAGSLQAVFETIGTAQTVERRTRFEVHKTSFHREFIAAALILLAAHYIIIRLFVRMVP